MRRTLVLMVVLALAALLVFGCSKDQAGYASYGQPAYQGGNAPQGYVGGGCAVEGPEPGNAEISDQIAAA
ncbi:MAG: hypothetical protein AABX34_02920 [Nanoarchaeota archaeon]